MITRFNCAIGAAIALVLLASLAGCASGAPQQTATAAYSQARADIERLRATATVVRARMKTTLEYAGTRVGQAEEAAGFLRFSLSSLGIATLDFTAAAGLIGTTPARLIAPTTTPAGPRTVGTITPLGRPTAVPVAGRAPATEVTSPLADENAPRLENTVMASGVNDFDCAIDANPRFTPQSEAIYVVGEAHNIEAGATISSRWHRRGTEVAYFSFLAEDDIKGACIWFFIDQTDTPFVVGTWSVDLRVNNLPLARPVVFQIVDG